MFVITSQAALSLCRSPFMQNIITIIIQYYYYYYYYCLGNLLIKYGFQTRSFRRKTKTSKFLVTINAQNIIIIIIIIVVWVTYCLNVDSRYVNIEGKTIKISLTISLQNIIIIIIIICYYYYYYYYYCLGNLLIEYGFQIRSFRRKKLQNF